MPLFRIHGVNRQTRASEVVVIEAADEVAAMEKVRLTIDASRIERLPDHPSAPSPNVPPDYAGLLWARAAFMFLAAMHVLFVGIAAVFAIAAVSSSERHGLFQPANAGVALLWSAGATIAAILYFGLAAACEALRDIARNSWRDKAP
jgi:hypothetical protein